MHTLPELGYNYDALEPHIDAQTMEIHYTKHHQGYVNKLNTALESHPELAEKDIESLLKMVQSADIAPTTKQNIINNAGGHANHSLFWQIMNPANKTDESLVSEIIDTFGSIANFKETFTTEALSRFGSGWSWLVRNAEGNLVIYSTANQDSPLLTGDTPLIGLDVWEHAYYLKYQNMRASYIENWWNVIKVIG